MHEAGVAGGGGGYTTPFAPYPANDYTVIADGNDLIDHAGTYCNVANAAYQKAVAAAEQTYGPLIAPIQAYGDQEYKDAINLKDAALLAGGCTRQFGHAIGIYDDGIQELDRTYWTEKANNFGVDDVDMNDPVVQDNPERAKNRHTQEVDAAEQELMGRLKQQKLGLDEDLDTAAHTGETTLDKGPSDEALLQLFEAGALPVVTTAMCPNLDFTQVDMGAMLRQLEKFGELPAGFDIEATLAALEDAKAVSDGKYEPFEMQRLLASMRDLSPAAFDYLVMGLSRDQLAALDEHAQMPGVNGLGHWGKIDFQSLFLSNVSGPMLDRLTEQWPSINPDLEGVDGIVDGDLPMPHWGTPENLELYELDENGNPEVSADDVDQGQLGDCWMQAKIAALAQDHPEWVTDHVEQNANGTITVVMYDDDGNAHNVTVTDELPLDDNGNPVFGGNDDGANWASYYEKAFAIASDHGSDGESGYGGIEGGSTSAEADLMTGNDAGDIDNEGGFLGIGDHKSMDDIREQFENGEAVVVSTTGDDKEQNEAYVSNHAFYVKGFTDDGKIILGNPWDDGEPDLKLTEDQFNEYIDGASVVHP